VGAGSHRYSRQSFLGDHSQAMIETCIVGVVGLGGGGSHIVQQLAHLGFQHYVLYDPDCVEDTNLNRLVGATEADVALRRPKIDIARRLIHGLQLSAKVQAYAERWQENPLPLRNCDVVFGCIDGFAERQQLEASARRYLIPYVDIGLDIHKRDDGPPIMAGQVILSMPGEPCFTCTGFLNESNLAREAARYGEAGIRPQVIWANGVLASTAVGVAVDLLTGWSGTTPGSVYLQYTGNDGIIKPHVRLGFLPGQACPHYPLTQAGDPVFRPV
jgi:hypothetical protein